HCNLGHLAVARDRPACAVGQRERHDEVILANEHALQFLPIAQSHRDGGGLGRSTAPAATATATAAGDPGILQRTGVGVLRRNGLEVACNRVAACALRLEVDLAGGSAADEHVEGSRV